MLKLIEKHWPLISILLLIALIACLLFWPDVSRPLGLTVLIISLAAGILIVTQKHIRAYRQGLLEWAGLIRNLAIEIGGILLTFAVVLFVAGRAAQAVGLLTGNAAEIRWPGTGAWVGLLAGLLVGLLIGFGIGRLVQTTWGRLVKRPRAVAANEI